MRVLSTAGNIQTLPFVQITESCGNLCLELTFEVSGGRAKKHLTLTLDELHLMIHAGLDALRVLAKE